MNATNLRLFFTILLVLTGSLAFGQNYSENFTSYDTRNDSFKYGYTWLATNSINSGGITGKTMRTGALSNPLSPSIMQTGWLNLPENATITFDTRSLNVTSAPMLTVQLVDMSGNLVNATTNGTYAYTSNAIVNRTVTFTGRAGWHRIRFTFIGTGGSSQVLLDNITSNIPATMTGSSSKLADLDVVGTANKTTFKVGDDFIYTMNVTNNGPDPAEAAKIKLAFPTGMTANTITYNGVTGTYDAATGIITLGTMAINGTGSVVINSTVAGRGNQVFSATMQGYGFMTDHKASNNVANISFMAEEVILPVVFAGITAKKNEDVNIITWSTASEKNAATFLIQYSTDGINFETVGQVAASGNSYVMRNYQYSHSTTANKAYYQILQLDFDGTATTSPRAVVNGETTTKVSAYPNPAKDFVTVTLNNESAPVLYTVAGQVVELNWNHLDGNTWTADLSNLQAGAYLLRSTSNDTKPVKLVKA